ncbi:hypothetical protein [Pendulispora albinea]|uniref:Secreted protein n=1 Tax=Pendulispora albinea TaxID=2741071 RepID=A0ABZ2LPM9_9BACT
MALKLLSGRRTSGTIHLEKGSIMKFGKGIFAAIMLTFSLVGGCSATGSEGDETNNTEESSLQDQTQAGEPSEAQMEALGQGGCTNAEIRKIQAWCANPACPRLGSKSRGLKFCRYNPGHNTCSYECDCVGQDPGETVSECFR